MTPLSSRLPLAAAIPVDLKVTASQLALRVIPAN